MRIIKKSAALSCVAVLGLVGGAVARDDVDVSLILQMHGAAGNSFAQRYDPGNSYEDHQSQTSIGSFGAVAFALGDNLSVQAEIWTRRAHIQLTRTGTVGFVTSLYTEPRPSVAGHVSWRPQDHQLIGVMVSQYAPLDTETFWPMYTVALEGAFGEEEWRVSGQIGHSFIQGEPSSSFTDSAYHAVARLSYYLNPNLSISASAGADIVSTSIGTFGEDHIRLALGGRIEYKPENTPVVGFLGYQARLSYDSNTDVGLYRNGAEHRLTFGVRAAFGTEATTLREFDDAIGLYDGNPYYGITDGER